MAQQELEYSTGKVFLVSHESLDALQDGIIDDADDVNSEVKQMAGRHGEEAANLAITNLGKNNVPTEKITSKRKENIADIDETIASETEKQEQGRVLEGIENVVS